MDSIPNKYEMMQSGCTNELKIFIINGRILRSIGKQRTLKYSNDPEVGNMGRKYHSEGIWNTSLY